MSDYQDDLIRAKIDAHIERLRQSANKEDRELADALDNLLAENADLYGAANRGGA